ncbi:glycosyltransferase family 4 protein [Geomonas sp. Red69]|uniref:glycosyltransferase family 4 protein n=1 Tax=Geomonas diazotrophica TaxID=2843197 RepID=UPI001C10937A|nr:MULTISPECIES: glycosyltransferase family 4 protein [Geomonas]MBU5636000.1 glycosyltransferase family 4 protein [Geomonas diazotrophica]QXE85922.1 glycosyltransferase family 4 protein [Geomonas nitrogeniifigens]
MRIGFVTTEYVTEEQNYDGGLSNYLSRISLALKSKGHEPVIVVASSSNGSFRHNEVEVNRVKALCYSKRLMKILQIFPGLDWKVVSWQLNRRIRRLHQEQPFDVVQYASVGATILSRHQDIPSVARISGNQKLWDIAYEEAPSRKKSAYQDLEIAGLGRADSLYGPSRVIADYLKANHGFDVQIIESPFVQECSAFNTDVYSNIRSRVAGDYLLFFGSLGLAKGVKTIADMAHDLLEKYPKLSMVFVGKDMGYNGQPIMSYVLERAGEHADRIVWHDRVKHEQLYPVIEGAKLVLLPSRIDNFPNCCVEAMAFKKVVIGTKGASFEQLIDDGISGLLSIPDDPQSLLAVVTKALDMPEQELQEIGERSSRRAMELSPEKIVEQLLAYYKDVIERTKAKEIKAGRVQ